MAVASALAKTGAKLAGRGLLGAAGGVLGGPVGMALMVGPELVGLIKDFFENDGGPDKMAQIKQARDGMAERLMSSEGLSREQAIEAVNQQLGPVLDSAAKEGQGRGGEIALDVAGLGAGLAMSGMGGKLLKGAKGLLGGAAKEGRAVAEEGVAAGSGAAGTGDDVARGGAAAAGAPADHEAAEAAAGMGDPTAMGVEEAAEAAPAAGAGMAAPTAPETPDLDTLRQMLLQARLVSPGAGGTRSPLVRRAKGA